MNDDSTLASGSRWREAVTRIRSRSAVVAAALVLGSAGAGFAAGHVTSADRHDGFPDRSASEQGSDGEHGRGRGDRDGFAPGGPGGDEGRQDASGATT